MKTALLVGLGALLLATGCGEASSDDPVDTTASGPLEATTSTTTEPKTEPDSEPVATREESPPSSIEVDDASPVDPPVLEPVTTKPVETAPQPTPAEPEGEPVPPPAIEHPNPQVVAAMTDLVGRLGVAADAIEVISVEEVTWPDGSVGCPQPGMRYTQALVNGSRIVLRVGGIDYQYNSGGGREPFYCADPSDPVPGGGDYGDI